MKRLKRVTAFLLCFCMVWNLSVPEAFAMSGRESQQGGESEAAYSVATASDAENGGTGEDDFLEVATPSDGVREPVLATPSDGLGEPVLATDANALKRNNGPYELSIINDNDNYSFPMKKGSTYLLDIKITPAPEAEEKPSFKSSDPSVAEVDESGLITAKSTGKATITASFEYNGKNDTASDSIQIEVIDEDPIVITLHANGGRFEDETDIKQIYCYFPLYLRS